MSTMPTNGDVKKQRTNGLESTFCPYDETSKAYDETRVPLGVGCTLGSFAMSEWPLNEQRLLDVGGGTGTFVQLVDTKFKDATLFEVNDGMLQQAKARLGERVACLQGSANALEASFKLDTYQAVTMNQVIHHFPVERDYAYLKEVFAQIHQVVAPGGAFVLNHCSHEQHQKSFWWYQFMPKACEKYCEKSPPLTTVIKYMREVGFEVDENEMYVPPAGLLMRDSYWKHGLEGAFIKSYRDGDSGWSMGEQTGELEACQKKIRELQAAGKEKEFIEKHEAERRLIGQTTFITARKQTGSRIGLQN